LKVRAIGFCSPGFLPAYTFCSAGATSAAAVSAPRNVATPLNWWAQPNTTAASAAVKVIVTDLFMIVSYRVVES
jgi:hypothetical protein